MTNVLPYVPPHFAFWEKYIPQLPHSIQRPLVAHCCILYHRTIDHRIIFSFPRDFNKLKKKGSSECIFLGAQNFFLTNKSLRDCTLTTLCNCTFTVTVLLPHFHRTRICSFYILSPQYIFISVAPSVIAPP